MSLTLSFYSRDSFREVNLPSINNSDYELKITGDQLGIRSDLSIVLEVVDNQWKIHSSRGYRLFVEDQRYDTVDLMDGLLLSVVTEDDETVSLIISGIIDPFHSLDKFRLTNNAQVSIGTGADCDIVCDFMGVSRDHAILFRSGNSTYIRSKGPNGLYINGDRVNGERELRFGDYINIIGLHIVYLGSVIAIDTRKATVRTDGGKLKKVTPALRQNTGSDEGKTLSTGKQIYRRSPRYVENIAVDSIEIEAPPALPEEKNQPLFLAIGPSITMALPMVLGCMLMIYSYRLMGSGSSMRSGLFMYSGLVMAVSSAIIGVIWTLANRKQQKKDLAEHKARRLQRYSEYLDGKEREIREAYERTCQSLNDNYPRASACIRYIDQTGELWSRNFTHSDFLVHRLGTGNRPFPMDIRIPQERFTMYDDELADRPAKIKDSYHTMYEVPVTVDLYRRSLIGIVGDDNKKNAVRIAQMISAHIAAGNCYTDVKMAFIYNGDAYTEGEWEFAKWLPHAWSEDKRTRFVASNREETADVLYDLGNVFRLRAENDSSSSDRRLYKPHYVLFVSDVSLIEGELISKYIFGPNRNYGLTTIILAEQYEELPNSCEFIIENTRDFCGYYETSAGTAADVNINFDTVDPEELTSFARRLSKLQVLEVESGGDIPSSLTFFEMMGVRRPEDLPVRELWTKNRVYDNIRGLVGQKAGGAPMYLDVHEKYHGPHGLVAGTTGSGKSETLQTYILSLAVNYSPDDVAFFIIDYKGGGMANLFDGLPHLAGQISNLSGNQVKRAMISIQSENRRRQRIFTENGVNNINNYTKLFKSGEATVPVPHLFIIIDEFAELKREEPEFMQELISVAQVGRSLGVHLILATQKPSGTVDDNIWSNSRFRLCLRVQDKQDSNDMLHKPDAAYITQAGRCYLQVGNDELYELFQSGYSGAVYDANAYSGSAEVAKLLSLSGKVEMTGNSIKQRQKKNAETAWVETLTEVLDKAAAEVISKNDGDMEDEANILLIADRMYNLLEEKNCDYTESKFNTSRLMDFIGMYSELSADGEEPTAEDILKHAQTGGIRLPQQKEHTELEAVRDYLGKVGREAGFTTRHQLWLPVLGDNISLDEISSFSETSFSHNKSWKQPDNKLSLSIPVGMMDDPENQSQMPFIIDFAEEGNLAVCGSVMSGKSTFLQTVMYSLIQMHSPEEVSIYALDFSSKMMEAFRTAPHVGGVMYEDDSDKMGSFFFMINRMLEERKKILKGGSFNQYVRLNGMTMPAVFVIIDNYGAFRQKTDEKYDQDMMKLAKEGISNGIYLVISGGGFSSAEIPQRLAENLTSSVTLSLKDKYEYGDILHTMRIEVMPESGVRGRGLAYYEGRILEYQTALAVSEGDYERMEAIKAVCDGMDAAWTGCRARQVRVIPEKPTWDIFSDLDEYAEMCSGRELLPVGYDAKSAEVYGISLADTFCYGIYGEAGSGRTNMMKACAMAARDMKAEVVILDLDDRDLGMFAGDSAVTYCDSYDEVFEYFKGMQSKLGVRGKRKRELEAKDFGKDEISRIFIEETDPLFIFIPEFKQFLRRAYLEKNSITGLLENLTSRADGCNIYIFAELDIDTRQGNSNSTALKNFLGYKQGINLGGNVEDNKNLNFDSVPYMLKSVETKPGIGQVPAPDEPDKKRDIVIPLVRRSDISL